MSKPNTCTICKHIGREMDESCTLEASFLYTNKQEAEPVRIHLCRTHSVELFKRGQKKFLLNYKRILDDLIDSDEMEFIRILDKTVRENRDYVY